MNASGVRIGNETLTYIGADKHIRPLRDQIIVEPLPWKPSSTIEVVTHAKPLRGRVLAVGPGCYPKRYNGPKGVRTKSWDAKCFRPTDVKVGDIVELGGLEIGGYLHQTVNWGGKEVVVCREEDVAGIVSAPCPDCGYMDVHSQFCAALDREASETGHACTASAR